MNKEAVAEKSTQAIKVLSEIVDWWEKWNLSENPHELEDPPIEEAKKILLAFDAEKT